MPEEKDRTFGCDIVFSAKSDEVSKQSKTRNSVSSQAGIPGRAIMAFERWLTKQQVSSLRHFRIKLLESSPVDPILKRND